jgi:hypothetical protein
MHLLDLEGDVELRVFETGTPVAAVVPDDVAARAFHPKAYIFTQGENGTAFIGSSNLSASALTSGVEWNYRVVSSRDDAGYAEVVAAFDQLFHHPRSTSLTPDWVDRYRARRPIPRPIVDAADVAPEPAAHVPGPNEIQQTALEALVATRAAGNAAGLVVLATGLGKTWLAAFDTNRPEFRRVLFVAHREEILSQALDTFRRIRPDARLGHYTGGAKDPDAEVIFASIQTLGRAGHLAAFAPDVFDYVVVDEFHHAAAASYRRLITHFRPRTLDKSGHGSEFQYRDHFVSRQVFEWQSQNRTTQEGADGRSIRHHQEEGIAVHLFVRKEKKRPGGGAAPFVYCGDVTFERWEGERPITVRWKLPEAVPDVIWSALNSGGSGAPQAVR